MEEVKVIGDVTFYCYDVVLTDEVIAYLEEFSQVCEDDAYTVYLDDGHLVVY